MVNHKNLKGRFGKFTIDYIIFEQQPRIVQQIMSKVVIVRAETLWGKSVEYYGFSNLFEKINPGEMAREYIMEVSSRGKVKAIKNDVYFIYKKDHDRLISKEKEYDRTIGKFEKESMEKMEALAEKSRKEFEDNQKNFDGKSEILEKMNEAAKKLL